MEMNKKEKKARKLIEKIEKKLKKEEAENYWEKYKPAGCFNCNNGQITNAGRTELDITTYRRCKCSKVKTKKYKKFMKRRYKMTFGDASQMQDMFYDNHAGIIEGNNATNRSW